MTAGIYLHIPFCKSRCSYCDFATDVWRSGDRVERYVKTICADIESFIGVQEAQSAGVSSSSTEGKHDRPRTLDADTIYFGGGTPSLLSSDQVGRILGSVRTAFRIAPDAEITMEMNPATVAPETLAAYRELGVNRASFGLQTFNERDLKLLARGHDANDARQTYRMLRAAGFDNISFDLIAGLPGQTLEDWNCNLEEAVAMEPEHLSLYLLEIHEGTPLAEQLRSGRRPMPDDELAAGMYETMIDTLDAAGYHQYEISNFALPGLESRHNSKYWRLEPVYGFGVSAHSFDGVERYANERDTNTYVRLVESGGTAEVFREPIDEAAEFAFLGLRMNEGIDVSAYALRFDRDLLSQAAKALENELIEIAGNRIRLTRKGMLFSNEVFADLL